MAASETPTRALKESLHVYNLPAGLVDVFSLRASPLVANTPAPARERPVTPVQAQSLVGPAPACTSCSGANFVDVSDQRAHFRSDWHRYNVKMRLLDSSYQPVNELQFARLVDGTYYTSILERTQF